MNPEIFECALNLPLFIRIKNNCGHETESAKKKFDWRGDEMEEMPHGTGWLRSVARGRCIAKYLAAVVCCARSSISMNDDELKLRMDAQRYGALSPREKYLLNVPDADRDGTP